MSKPFIDEDFLLQSKSAKKLYHEFATDMPIYDYHNHLPVEQIANDHQFKNMTELWLSGDHYKWRAMRTNGTDEKYCTGMASDREKFEKWAETVPYTLGNPLYHWTHMELAKPFGITDVLVNSQTAGQIYDQCNEMLKSPEFSVRNLLKKFNVKVVCTTEGPLDTLEHHKRIRQDDFEVNVHTAFRPDRFLVLADSASLNEWIDQLGKAADIDIKNLSDFLEAMKKRHDYFHENGCRLSDYGLEAVPAENYTKTEVAKIFENIRACKDINFAELQKFRSAMLYECVLMDAESGWVMQLHLGALRNVNTRLFRSLGPDKGFDSIGDYPQGLSLAKFLDSLDTNNKLPKTILYNLNPADNELFATMIGNFQDGSVPGKIQYGSAWWFLDQMDGMKKQIKALSSLGLLSRFIGMLTDSRSFVSFSRHEYFRRILCNMLGSDIEKGKLPADFELLGGMVQDICFNNAQAYFPMQVD